MAGYILTHRSILDNWIWGAEKKSFFEAWMYILLKANYEDARVRVGFDLVEIKRGEFFTSQEQLGIAFRWDRSTVRRFLQLLQKDNMIKVEATTKFTKLTICKYESYQENRPTEIYKNSKKNKKSENLGQDNELSFNELGEDVTNETTTDDQRAPTTKQELIKNKQLVIDVLQYLNEKTGKDFKPASKKNGSLINARQSEGYKLDDFKKVIDCKVSKWQHDAKMKDFLRPETLFGNKFEGYLNECAEPVKQKQNYVDHHEYIFGTTAN